MIGIIGAMDVECEYLINALENKTGGAFGTAVIFTGKIGTVNVAVARCSPGKVNAAMCTQVLIDKFGVTEIINTGVGCSLSENVKIMDVVVADSAVQYDIDITALGEPRGLVNGLNEIEIKTDEKISQSLYDIAKCKGGAVHRGIIASGDTFISGESLKNEIKNTFGAVSGDMEGGAVAQVARANGVPFAVLRTVSDGGDENAQIDYPQFKKIAAEKSTAIILDYIKNLAN